MKRAALGAGGARRRGLLSTGFSTLLLAAILAAGGCGQMGPLYRPQPPANEGSPSEP